MAFLFSNNILIFLLLLSCLGWICGSGRRGIRRKVERGWRSSRPDRHVRRDRDTAGLNTASVIGAVLFVGLAVLVATALRPVRSGSKPEGRTGPKQDGSCRKLLRKRGIRHTIPERTDQKEQRTCRGGRSPSFDAQLYKWRNVVERCVNKLSHWRRIATRYEKRALNYRAVVVIVTLMIWLAP